MSQCPCAPFTVTAAVYHGANDSGASYHHQHARSRTSTQIEQKPTPIMKTPTLTPIHIISQAHTYIHTYTLSAPHKRGVGVLLRHECRLRRGDLALHNAVQRSLGLVRGLLHLFFIGQLETTSVFFYGRPETAF